MNNLINYFVREKIIKLIREYFYKQNFHEVIVPILNDALPIEKNLSPFTTTWNTLENKQTFFLPMSPERSLKIKLSQGIGNCFAIGHSFRNLENKGSLHNPEFLMLEWYRENADYKKIMEDVQELIKYLESSVGTTSFTSGVINWPVFSIADMFKKYVKIDMDDAIEKGEYDKLFVNEIESRLPNTPLFLIDFPSSISPLCQPQKNRPDLAERFEFYINKIEMGNGNTENIDYKSVEKSFKSLRIENQPIDNDFLNALKIMKSTGKSYAGIGVGIDRLAMLFARISTINI